MMNHTDSCTGKSQKTALKSGLAQPHVTLLPIVLISLLSLATFLLLFIFRSLDDNTLTSWLWVFSDTRPLNFFLILAAGILIAYTLSRLSFPEHRSVLLIFVSSFITTAYFWQEPEIIVDASRYFMQAKYLELHGVEYFLKEWGKTIPAWTDLPLAPFIYGVIFRVFGESRTCIQVFTTFLFSGSVLLTYLIGRTLWSKDVGLYAGILLLGMPYLITQVPLMMVDVAAMFFLTLAVFVTIKAVETGKPALCIFASVAISLAMLTKYSNWLMLSVIPIIFLAYFQQGWKVLARRGLALAAGVLMLTGTALLAQFDLVIEQLRLLHDFQAPALRRWHESHLSTYFFQVHPVITISALFSVYVAVVKKDVKYIVIGWMVVLIFFLEIKRIRYSLGVFPMLAMMSAYGIAAIRSLETRKFIVCYTAVSAILIAATGYLPFLEKTSAMNIKQAGRYLDTIEAGTTLVFVLPQMRSSINPSIAVPMLDLYTKQGIVYYETGALHAPDPIGDLPWRWTWEIRTPRYYVPEPGMASEAETVVVIQSRRGQQIPAYLARRLEAFRLLEEFSQSSGVFRYRTLVKVYQRIE